MSNAVLSPPAEKLMNDLDAEAKLRFEYFQFKELLVNITKHQLVPTHEIMPDDEKRKLLDRYKVKESQLPRMLVSDPVAKYYGLRRGQVCKIIRTSETSGTYVTYRIVV